MDAREVVRAIDVGAWFCKYQPKANARVINNDNGVFLAFPGSDTAAQYQERFFPKNEICCCNGFENGIALYKI